VRNRPGPRPDHEIPLFIHQLAGDVAADGFESPTLANGASYPHAFGPTEQAYPYHCKIHGVTMAGTVTVQVGAPATVSVVIGDNFFSPATVTVAPGGTVGFGPNRSYDLQCSVQRGGHAATGKYKGSSPPSSTSTPSRSCGSALHRECPDP
jgi:plastocyanin